MSGEITSPSTVVSEYFANVEKKQRNLMKRKDMLKKGLSLTSDQEKAVSEYDQVCQNIASLKETADILGEIQTKIDNSVQETLKRIDEMRDEYAVEVLGKLVPILDLLSMARSPSVKAAITKRTSQQQSALLEKLSKSSIISLPAVADLENDSINAFKAPATCLLKLANSDPSPINGKPKAVSYSDVRKLCLSLLADEQVRSTLAVPFTEIPKKKSIVPSKDSKRVDRSPCSSDSKDKPVPASDVLKAAGVPPIRPAPEPLPAELILNRVINPLKTSFNFLQASHLDTVPIISPTSQEIMQKQNDNHESTSVMPSTAAQDPVEVLKICAKKTCKEEAPLENASIINDALVVTSQKSPSIVNEKVKPKHIRRGSGNKETNQRVHGRLSPQEAINAEIPHQRVSKRPIGAKSWADRARGIEAGQTSELPTDIVTSPPEHPQNGHAGPRQHKSPSSRQANVADGGTVRHNARPNGAPHRGGGYRGGSGGRGPYRGMCSNSVMIMSLGGRGRGSHRGSYHARGDLQSTDAGQPIQSMC